MKPDRLTPELDLQLVQANPECPLRVSEPYLAHSKGKPDVCPQRTNIYIRFAAPSVIKFKIQYCQDESAWRDEDGCREWQPEDSCLATKTE